MADEEGVMAVEEEEVAEVNNGARKLIERFYGQQRADSDIP
jgi:regulator of RNase E activity RraA